MSNTICSVASSHLSLNVDVQYAMSVIVGRALPDVRDGLKPVHRRILFAMHDLGLAHNKPYRCACTSWQLSKYIQPHHGA